MLRALAFGFVGLIVAVNAQQKRQSPAEPEEACRPAALRDFCRVGCPDPGPIPTRRVEPDLKKLQRPLPRGVAILEVGIDLEGRVVSACVVRGLRNDFDKAAQAAVRQGQWTVGLRRGKERGFVLYVSVCTPDNKCGPTPAKRPHTDLSLRGYAQSSCDRCLNTHVVATLSWRNPVSSLFGIDFLV
jgi:hypothetical protein